MLGRIRRSTYWGDVPGAAPLPMAYTDPPAGGIASDNVSPVTASQTPEGKLLSVGPRDGNGIPTGTAGLQSLVTKSYDMIAYKILRKRLLFDPLATVRTTTESHQGAALQFNFVNDLDDSPTTALLVEDYDVLPTPLKSWSNSFYIQEFGRVVTKTKLIRGTTMVALDPVAAERVSRNMAATMDRRAMNVLLASGGVQNDGSAGGAVTDITVTGKPSDTLRAAAQSFMDNNVEPFENGMYRAILTPSALTALKKESDAAGWRYYQINQDGSGGTGDIARGVVGEYEGFQIAWTSQLANGTGGVFVGAEAFAKGFSRAPGYGPVPQIVVSPVVDRLMRFTSLGWYWLGDYARFRAEAVVTGNPAG